MNRFLIGVILIISTNSYAMNWQGRYGANLEVGTDDNFFLRQNNETDTNFANLSLSAGADGSSETGYANFLVTIIGHEYSDKTINDDATSRFSLAMAHQGERLDSDLDLGYANQTTYDSELLDTGLRIDGRRESIYVTPGLNYRLNERHSLSGSLDFEDVSYNTSLLRDFQDKALNLSWGYGLDEKSEISLNLRYSQYKQQNVSATDTSSIFLGYNLETSRSTNYDFTLGYTSVEGPQDTRSSTTYRIEILNNPDELNTFTFRLSQLYRPSGIGTVRLENRLGLGWVHFFTEHFQGLLSADYLGTKGRDYYEVKPGIGYQFTQHLNLAGSYRYRRDDNKILGIAESNTVLFTLSYNR